MVNALLVYPKNPVTFWSFDWALKIAGKKSAFPPAGLLTVAGMLPKNYDVKLVDTNVYPLKNEDINWADVVLTSSMIIHWNSLEEIIQRANELERPVLAGGPLPTQYYDEIKGNATFFLGEAEEGFLDVLESLVAEGYKEERKVVDKRKRFSPLNKTPVQRFDLIKKHYSAMAIQATRGCPEKCTFCNIPSLYGSKTRLKETKQVIQELQSLYDLGWKGSIMIVDDNFVGNQHSIMDMLKHIVPWQKEHNYPFSFFTQASLRLYENLELMEAMYQAGFDQVFFGLESPSPESLKFMGAQKNLQSKNERGKKSMLEKVREVQADYFKAQAGFIIGLDTDPSNIADLTKDFIQQARISVAMVGPLGVLPDTKDYERFSKQGRLVKDVRYGGESGIFTRKLSYIPRDKDGNDVDPNIILNRHREIVEYINSPRIYLERTLDYIKNRKRKPLAKIPIDFSKVTALFRSFYYQGIKSDYKKEYWNYLWEVAKHDLYDLPDAISYAVEGHHLITTTQESLKVDDVNTSLEKLLKKIGNLSENLRLIGQEYLKDVIERYRSIKGEFKSHVEPAYRTLLEQVSYDNLTTRNYT